MHLLSIIFAQHNSFQNYNHLRIFNLIQLAYTFFVTFYPRKSNEQLFKMIQIDHCQLKLKMSNIFGIIYFVKYFRYYISFMVNIIYILDKFYIFVIKSIYIIITIQIYTQIRIYQKNSIYFYLNQVPIKIRKEKYEDQSNIQLKGLKPIKYNYNRVAVFLPNQSLVKQNEKECKFYQHIYEHTKLTQNVHNQYINGGGYIVLKNLYI
eukprot:TRINITY_DN1897_c0_g1_i2.p1 TRINITY_DN1897_c0_g1~~TRINITY_DN1897_c0_g1_i2.p1  ORF type:complete len:207 (+),score=-27.70 TRINITY_DN1897_c0_g1_i2:618-1238(+)